MSILKFQRCKKTDRYKDNKFDTLLEKGSKSIAINTIKNICNIDKSIKSIQYIYILVHLLELLKLQLYFKII